MEKTSEKELFETLPVHKAVAALAVPTIISQIVSIVYNLADTMFIGQMGDPYMVSAVTLVATWFNLLTAIGNLFGIGGSSLAARLMGAKHENEVKYVSSFCFYGGIAFTLIFSLLSLVFQEPLLNFLGASDENIRFSRIYLLWVVIIGGIPTVLNMLLGHFLRSEGHAKLASAGITLGGVLNMILDPIFIFGFRFYFVGAGIATALSNIVATVFFFLNCII